MLRILEHILRSYDDLISERLIPHRGVMTPSKGRKGLGRHVHKDDPEGRFCRGRRIRKRGFRQPLRTIATVFGKLRLPIRVAECCHCRARYSPLLDALKLMPYSRKESNFEHEVIEAVIDTNYRRLIEGHSIDISLGGIHNLVVGSDVNRLEQPPVDTAELSAIMADGTGYKCQQGKRAELRSVIGVTTDGQVEPLGTFANTSWDEIERVIKERLKITTASAIPFIYDGEPGLDDFLDIMVDSLTPGVAGRRRYGPAQKPPGLRRAIRGPFSPGRLLR
jgi:hypothetical protein